MLVSLLIGGPAFACVPRMFVYHEKHPMQYIGVVAVCYALVAALWTVCMKRQRRGVLRILEVLAVILVALFPDFWLRKLVGGFVDGLMVGPRLVFYSFPYNLMALIVGYFATTCLNAFFHQLNGEVKGREHIA